jgi:hypothetical protein
VVARHERASLFCARVALDAPARGRSSSSLAAMPRRRHSSPLLVLLIAVTSASGLADQKPTVVNLMSTPMTEGDRLLNEHFGTSYSVVNISVTDQSHSYKVPSYVKALGPTAPAFVANRCVSGQVTVGYVITLEGKVASLYVMKSTNPLLNDVARQRMDGVLFHPTELDGRPVASLATTTFMFQCPG